MRTSRIAAIAIAAAISMTGCGGSDSTGGSPATSPGDTSSGSSAEPNEAAAPTSVTKGQFCAGVEAAAAAKALNVDPAKFKQMENLEPGDKYGVERVDGPQLVSDQWLCSFGTIPTSPKHGFVALVMEQRPATAASVEAELTASRQSLEMGVKTKCVVEPDESWGPNGVMQLCTRPEVSTPQSSQSAFSEVTYRGLFDDVDFRCIVGTTSDLDTARTKAAGAEICPAALAMIAE